MTVMEMPQKAVPGASEPTFDVEHPDAQLVARATELVPLIREHAAQGSEDRRVAPEVINALGEAQLFRLLMPRRYGGLAASLRTTCEVLAEVARGDGSTGWTAAILATGTPNATLFSAQAQEDVFGKTPDARVCGAISPKHTSERVEGGYLVSGSWAYASGSFAANWAALSITADGQPAAALVPAEAWTIEPTWQVVGMRGTGSDTIVLKEHFVPEHRVQLSADVLAGNPGTPYRDDNFFWVPALLVANIVLAAVHVGLGRHALEHTLANLPDKRVIHTIYPEGRLSPTHQIAVAKAASNLHLAELSLQRMCLDVDRAIASREPLDLLTRGRIRNDICVVAELVKEGIDELMTANGSSSFAESNVLSRIWRDSNTGSRHTYINPHLGKEAYGRLLLGNMELTGPL